MSLYQSFCGFFKSSKIGIVAKAGVSLASLYSETARNAAIWGLIWMGLDFGPAFKDLTKAQKLGVGSSFLSALVTENLLLAAGFSASTTCLMAPMSTYAFFKLAEKGYTYLMEPIIMEELEQANTRRRQSPAGRSFMIS